MTAWFQWSSPSPLTFLNTATALFLSQTSCPEVGKYPLLGIASVSFPWQWSHADFFSGCLLKCSQFSSFICLTLYYRPPLPWNLVPVQSKRHTEGWPWGPCLLLCNLCPWRSPWTSMLRSAAVNPLSGMVLALGTTAGGGFPFCCLLIDTSCNSPPLKGRRSHEIGAF